MVLHALPHAPILMCSCRMYATINGSNLPNKAGSNVVPSTQDVFGQFHA